MTTPGPDGWTVTDHLAHLAAWAHKAVALSRRRGAHVGNRVITLKGTLTFLCS